jgi:hypothetical protein
MNERLQNLLDRQDSGELLTDNEREAEGLVDLAEFPSLLRARSNRFSSEVQSPTPNVSSPASDI